MLAKLLNAFKTKDNAPSTTESPKYDTNRPQTNSSTINRIRVLAGQFESNEQWTEAAQQYEQLISMEPNNPQWIRDLAFVLTQDEQYERALTAYLSADKLQPEEPNIHYNIGYIHTELHQYEKAKPYLKKAIELDPHHSQAHCYLGVTYQGMQDHETAIEQFKHAINIDPNSSYLYFNLGISLVALNRLDEAQQCYSTCSRMNRGEPINSNLDQYLSSPLREEPNFNDTAFKIEHDTEQFKFLAETEPNPIFKEVSKSWQTFFSTNGIDELMAEGAALKLPNIRPNCIPEMVKKTHNRPIRVINSPKFKHALNPNLDTEAIEDQFFSHSINATAIDNVLTDEALKELRDFP